MYGPGAPGPLASHLTAPQVGLWDAHRARIPRPDQARLLLQRWAETSELPAAEGPFLHLLYLAGSSEALFLALLRHPDQLASLSAQVQTPEGLGREGLDEALARWLLARRWPSHAPALASFRSLQTARIFLQDVLGVLPFDALTAELSALADVLIARGLALTYQPLRESLGLPMAPTPDGRSAPCHLTAFALGKLGGGELNYASDVDLIFLYGADGITDRGHPNQSFFNAWVQAASGLLTAPTPDGPCLRLDANLRPRGRDGELTLSLDGALAYYREWAELWERQAWIKARPCAGDLEQGALFLRQMESVVYQAYAWNGISVQNRRMRDKAVKQLGRAGAHGDLKEGPGGIRDAEFAVQALQLAHGQEDRWVRERHCLLAMAKLRQKGVLSTARHAALAQGYVLLRRAEHWAQAQDMRQTHHQPTTDEEWKALATYLRTPSAEETRRQVEAARTALRAHFLHVLAELASRDAALDSLTFLLSPEGMRDALERARFPDVERAVPLLAEVYAALQGFLDAPHRKENFVRVHYSLQREFERTADPLHALQGLHRIVLALATEPRGAVRLLERPRLARLLVRLIGRSEPVTESLQRWPFLLELLGYETLRGLPSHLEEEAPVERDPDHLRQWHKELLFLAESREVVMGESLAWAQDVHTQIADMICARVFRQACRETEEREGLEPGLLAREVGLLGLGRLGLREMHPRSDLDLVCVKRRPWVLAGDADRSALVEGRFLRTLASSFTAVTRHGALYPVDFRLRPYGGSGAPLSSLDAIRDYFATAARLWERLAYLKGRPVAGDRGLGAEALDAAWKASLERGAPEEELAEPLDLRRRLEEATPGLDGALKFGSGGLLHLDLLLLVLQTRAGLAPGGGGTPGLLLRLEEAGVLPPDVRTRLFLSRTFQDTLLHRSRIRFERPPGRRATQAALRTLERLWPSTPEGGDRHVLAGSGLAAEWRRHRSAVEGAWEDLVR